MNLFDKFNVDKMVVFNMISVHKDYGGQGIGRVLAQKSEDFLKNEKSTYNLVNVEKFLISNFKTVQYTASDHIL